MGEHVAVGDDGFRSFLPPAPSARAKGEMRGKRGESVVATE